jgi:polyhydroxyalkanoic acid synthase PhaR subunit
MAEETKNTAKDFDKAKTFDPMEPWRGMRDAYLDVWAKTMVEMVNSEAYSQATGAMLDTYLTMSAPFREAVEKAMLKTLEQLAMPTRNDVISIAERMTNIEMRLDDLDGKIDELLARSSNPAARPAASASAVVRREPQRAGKRVGRSGTTKKGKK